MSYVQWQTGMVIEGPVYLDANILVGAVIRGQCLYASCVRLIADLLGEGLAIRLSPLCFQEALWAMARISYFDLFGQRPSGNFNVRIYEKWYDRIFERHGARIGAVGAMIRDWIEAGAPVEVVPKLDSTWNEVMGMTPNYMKQYGLAPADALHLALAETHARTFVTADSDFQKASSSSHSATLAIVHMI